MVLQFLVGVLGFQRWCDDGRKRACFVCVLSVSFTQRADLFPGVGALWLCSKVVSVHAHLNSFKTRVCLCPVLFGQPMPVPDRCAYSLRIALEETWFWRQPELRRPSGQCYIWQATAPETKGFIGPQQIYTFGVFKRNCAPI